MAVKDVYLPQPDDNHNNKGDGKIDRRWFILGLPFVIVGFGTVLKEIAEGNTQQAQASAVHTVASEPTPGVKIENPIIVENPITAQYGFILNQYNGTGYDTFYLDDQGRMIRSSDINLDTANSGSRYRIEQVSIEPEQIYFNGEVVLVSQGWTVVDTRQNN